MVLGLSQCVWGGRLLQGVVGEMGWSVLQPPWASCVEKLAQDLSVKNSTELYVMRRNSPEGTSYPSCSPHCPAELKMFGGRRQWILGGEV